ncbi:MAG: UDP-glucose/GDP-mannose dehydrogenase family protein [Trueperaceae bacterium]|jgi:UDPglucose 6-dehydrogenase|nr:UDP-glucose/GDP-mannose dehydrogenase family protein [Truepera sp.]HRN19742.1 UDP-glucose/GDP-mannose dehydrogenase family protein [Trueperaceae bacterium]
MRVTIIGTGYVGLTTGAALAYLGHEVTFVDKKASIIEKLASGVPTIHEGGLLELMAAGKQRSAFRTSIPELSGEGVVLIAVGTPSKENGDADLSYVDAAANDVADRITEGARLVVVNKSTVPVGSARHVQGIIARRLEARGVSADVHIASNPEFLAEGRAVHDSLYPDRIVVGSDTPYPWAVMRELYSPILEQTFEAPPGTPRPERFELPPLITTTTTSAELTKYAANAFLATKISFINEFSVLAEKVGADIVEVARAIGLDNRIGSKFLNAGIGWGGSCFGKDTAAVLALGGSYDYQMPIVRAAVDVNRRQRLYVVEKLQQHLKVLRGTTIGLLGLAFKGNTDDLRDAPALTLIRELTERGAVLKVHDPVAMPNARAFYPDLPVQYAESETELALGCDALVVVTDWPQYRQLDFSTLAGEMRGDLVLDARNMLQASAVTEAGLKYVGIGR